MRVRLRGPQRHRAEDLHSVQVLRHRIGGPSATHRSYAAAIHFGRSIPGMPAVGPSPRRRVRSVIRDRDGQKAARRAEPGEPRVLSCPGKPRTSDGSGSTGHDRSLLTRLVRAEEGSSADAPRPGVLACLGAEEPDMPQGLHQRLRSAIVEPGVGSMGWKLAGDQFQAQQLDVIAAEDLVLSAECLEDAQQAGTGTGTRRRVPVLRYDGDYELIAQVTGQPVQ